MKTSLILSTVLVASTLSPATFANGAQEQAAAVASTLNGRTAAGASVAVFTVQQLPQVESVTRTVLEQLDLDVRANLLSGLRANSSLVVEALKMVAPSLVEVASKPLEPGSR